MINVPTFKEEEITLLSFKHGATGISEALAYAQNDLTYEPEILHRRNHDLDVFFTENPPTVFFTALSELIPQLQWQTTEEETKDWLAEWKKGFVPFQLAGPYWVVPSWIVSPVASKFTITIDPGMAFGTGTHATTKMASYFVHKLCSRLKEPGLISLIDVGTGTGILAMLAQKHNLGQVVGIEIDPEARRVARENIKLNNLNQIEIPDLLVEEVKKTFDIVVANIIDGILVQIKPQLLHLLNPGGHLFLTGILLEREDYFFNSFIEGSGLTVIRRVEQDEWVGYWVQA